MKHVSEDPREQIIQTMKRVYEKKITTATGGNISIKDPAGVTWITPGGIDKAGLKREDIVAVGTGESRNNIHNPSVELPLHEAIYKARKDIGAVIHAHPPAAVTFSITRQPLDTGITAVTRQVCGEVVNIPFEVSGTDRLAEEIGRFFREGCSCALMENHGVVVGGKDTAHAYRLLETLEYCAQVHLHAHSLGEIHLIESTETDLRKSSRILPQTDESIQAAEDIATLMQRMYLQDLCICNTGMLSKKTDTETFHVPDEAADRGTMEADNIGHYAVSEKGASGNGSLLHSILRSIYTLCDDVWAVCIASPAAAAAFAAAHKKIDTRLLPESHVMVRDIPLLPEKILQTPAELASRLSRNAPVALVENTGLIIVGKDLMQCFNRLEITEFAAQSILQCAGFAEPIAIGPDALKELEDRFLELFY